MFNLISKKKIEKKEEIKVPENMFIKCPNCCKMVQSKKTESNLCKCPECAFYFPMTSLQRINMICDEGSFKPIKVTLKKVNPLNFEGYPEKIKALQEKTNLKEAVSMGSATIRGQKVVIGVMEHSFLLGSLSSQVGKILVKSFDYATSRKLPVVLYTVSGGARMQEGVVSLMQMAAVSAAIKRHSNAGLFYMPILTNPTTGGVTASFAMLGDIIMAEPNALICFAGPRVIKETIKQDLPEGFQKSEFLLEHGFLDKIITRENQRAYIGQLIKAHKIYLKEK
ncbi:MAG: acetyl-CoA carboxylase, carboxyltransferase subunit beta [Mycoplasmatales bacterium]